MGWNRCCQCRCPWHGTPAVLHSLCTTWVDLLEPLQWSGEVGRREGCGRVEGSRCGVREDAMRRNRSHSLSRVKYRRYGACERKRGGERLQRQGCTDPLRNFSRFDAGATGAVVALSPILRLQAYSLRPHMTAVLGVEICPQEFVLLVIGSQRSSNDATLLIQSTFACRSIHPTTPSTRAV
jgi:hypothetical protein